MTLNWSQCEYLVKINYSLWSPQGCSHIPSCGGPCCPSPWGQGAHLIYVTCHMSHVTCHMSHLTCHIWHGLCGMLGFLWISWLDSRLYIYIACMYFRYVCMWHVFLHLRISRFYMFRLCTHARLLRYMKIYFAKYYWWLGLLC